MSVSLEQSGDVWFPDGNIILLSVEKIAFRVFKGFLAQHSPVFRDMFAIAQLDKATAFDECPVLLLSDSAFNLSPLLRLLTGVHDFLQTEKSLQFSGLASVILLSHKYQMERIRDRALQLLEDIMAVEPPQDQDVKEYLAFSSLSIMPEDAFAIVNLASLTGRNSLLPMAFYMCCFLSPVTLIHGFIRSGFLCKLQPGDVVRCFSGKSQLANACAISFLKIYDYNLDMQAVCSTPSKCRPSFHGHIRKITKYSPKEITSCNALSAWAACDIHEDICDQCSLTLSDRVKATHSEVEEFTQIFRARHQMADSKGSMTNIKGFACPKFVF
ncbi:hypothetical protein CERSUDRAFT_97887 [Gelatoporia subvermispora B]|uniref:BTB domain-containing protein n=1 Tax=Ceriporiopsis subvermispora (strain B) TaxID=914234 RepID=M2R6R7_CERS8|nr:hypothetical protein CERSUDRAFT_97887 [Gelatoporia subvermispora B]